MGASKFQQLPSLPAVPEELSIVAKEIWQGKFFLNQNFTLNNLKSIRSSQPFGIIHLATHGEFEEGTLDNSFIQFWDSKLKLSQIRDLGLNNPTIELLVLSACRTALGDREAELGFGGFAYKAGVKTAIASLWQVSDSGTLGLMTELYKNLKIVPIKAEALRQAQIALIVGLDLQLTPNSLLPSQQFVIGGVQTVRGYRQNARSGDNGVRFSIENQITVLRNEAGLATLLLSPFIDLGAVWNQSDNPNNLFLPRQRFLSSGGLGLLWQPIPNFNVRLDYGIPFVNLSDRGNNVQDSGFHFSVYYQP